MSDIANADELRMRATSRLTGSSATHGPSRSFDALAVVHRMAMSPSTADSALALLHELQVHQVELDMQAEELRESRLELEAALRRQIELYALQPVGCFTIDADCVVQELNRAGAAMLGVERDHGVGLALDSFLDPAGGTALRALLSKLATDEVRVATRVALLESSGRSRTVRADAGVGPSKDHYLVVLTEV